MRIYVDHNATTPVHPAVFDVMAHVLRNDFGNASSVHSFGQTAKAHVDGARAAIAKLIGAKPQEIVFTSGGTEADNLAIRGITETPKQNNRRHLITSSIEHEAVLMTFKALAKHGWTISLLPVDRNGKVDPESLEKIINDKTALVSIMHANNEIGTVQPIADLAAIAHAYGAKFHSDAVQSTGKIPVKVDELNVDMLSLSGHKFNGPKGIGALWIRRGLRLAATVTGGGQERNRRAGTENVSALVGFGEAARIAASDITTEAQRLSHLRDKLENGILKAVQGAAINGNLDQRLPNTTNISFDRVEAESLLIGLDLEGIAVSTGSACSSGTLAPSHVLRAMGFSPHRTQNSIRFSLGLGNTVEQIDHIIQVIPKVVDSLRRLSIPKETFQKS